MPVNINDIATATKPLDQKIFEFLSSKRDEFYTSEEIQSELGEFRGFMELASKVSADMMWLGLLADVAAGNQVGKTSNETQRMYATALTTLLNDKKIQCVEYGGSLRFGVTKAMPAWVEQPALV